MKRRKYLSEKEFDFRTATLALKDKRLRATVVKKYKGSNDKTNA